MNDRQIRRWFEAYFYWLEPQVRDEGHQRHTYVDLLATMFAKEFVWLIPNDDNRMIDAGGIGEQPGDLRVEFLHESEAPRGLRSHMFGPCSVLEVLIGLSRRLAFAASGTAEGWAWQLVVNLELHRMPDPLSRRKTKQVNEVLDRLVWRNYDPDGTGGFFPLQTPEEDQTQVELWYQMSAFINEIHPEY